MAIDTEPFMVECLLAVEWLSKAVGVPTAFISDGKRLHRVKDWLQ